MCSSLFWALHWSHWPLQLMTIRPQQELSQLQKLPLCTMATLFIVSSRAKGEWGCHTPWQPRLALADQEQVLLTPPQSSWPFTQQSSFPHLLLSWIYSGSWASVFWFESPLSASREAWGPRSHKSTHVVSHLHTPATALKHALQEGEASVEAVFHKPRQSTGARASGTPLRKESSLLLETY